VAVVDVWVAVVDIVLVLLVAVTDIEDMEVEVVVSVRDLEVIVCDELLPVIGMVVAVESAVDVVASVMMVVHSQRSLNKPFPATWHWDSTQMLAATHAPFKSTAPFSHMLQSDSFPTGHSHL
jgi:hypothetical protein